MGVKRDDFAFRIGSPRSHAQVAHGFSLNSPMAFARPPTRTPVAGPAPPSSVPTTSISEFLSAVQVRFLDNVASARRSTAIGARVSSADDVIAELCGGEEVLSPAGHQLFNAMAMRTVHQLLNWACDNLSEVNETTRARNTEVELEINQKQPVFLRRFAADGSLVDVYRAAFKSLKSVSRLDARIRFYEWRSKLESATAATLTESESILVADLDLVQQCRYRLEEDLAVLHDNVLASQQRLSTLRQFSMPAQERIRFDAQHAHLIQLQEQTVELEAQATLTEARLRTGEIELREQQGRLAALQAQLSAASEALQAAQSPLTVGEVAAAQKQCRAIRTCVPSCVQASAMAGSWLSAAAVLGRGNDSLAYALQLDSLFARRPARLCAGLAMRAMGLQRDLHTVQDMYPLSVCVGERAGIVQLTWQATNRALEVVLDVDMSVQVDSYGTSMLPAPAVRVVVGPAEVAEVVRKAVQNAQCTTVYAVRQVLLGLGF
jgi:hypothetical protein